MRVENVNQVARIPNIREINYDFPINNSNKEGKLANNANENIKKGNNRKFTEEELIQAIEGANKKIEFYNTRLEFSIHEKTKEIIVKIVDSSNDEIVREIPPEKILDMIAGLMELAGIIVDKKV